MSGAPVKKLPASPSVSSPSVPVADRGSEKVNIGFSDLGAASGIRSGIHALESAPRRDAKRYGSSGDSVLNGEGISFSVAIGVC
jgi:hypothetical protein